MKVIRIKPGSRVQLHTLTTDGELDAINKEQGQTVLEALREDMRRLQRVLFAARTHRLLIVLQGMDGSGKDGTVRNVFHGIDPHGFKVMAFKGPTQEELDHDFLWRIHPHVPARGCITVFNRSHYEDVVTVGVKNLLPRPVWQRRYQHIIDFERMLVEEGTTILKLFLHISPEEQGRRLHSRIQNPEKHWKFHPDDAADRMLWPQIQAAYNEALSRTSTEAAPWFVVPGNSKWRRNIAIATLIRDTLSSMNLKFPAPAFDPATVRIS